MLDSFNARRIAVILAAAAMLHCLIATEASAQLRGLGVPSVGTGVGGSGLGGSGLGGGLGGTGLGSGTGGLGLPSADRTVGGTTNNVTGTASGAANGIAGTVSSTVDRMPPLNSVTNSLMGGVRNAVSNATNPALNPAALGRDGAGQNIPRSGVPPVGERRFVPNEVVVGLDSNISRRELEMLAQRHRLAVIERHDIPLIGRTYYRWRITDGGRVPDVIAALETDRLVRHAQPNYRFTLAQSPVASLPQVPTSRAELDAGTQYASAKLHLGEAHRFATGDKVLVAVIDSAIDTSHPEIIDAVADRFDAIPPTGGANPHGTGMAGAIVARTKLMGVAPNVRLLAIRAFNGEGDKSEATTLSLLTGLDWAVAHGARIINMSFAGPYDPDMARGIAAAKQKGVVLIAAAGNAGPKSPPLYPAADKNVIAVTAIDADNRLLSAANRGKHIALAAPGVDVLVPAPGRAYQLTTGTSVAAAEVSGIAALLVEIKPSITSDEVRQILQSTAFALGPKGLDDQFGAGLADAERAVTALSPEARRPEGAILF
ncbi:MAG: S8 family serine peptidase, partial [Xanthobacteraceae bacterium]|nr:S8 family serine peptidase [Xanthobacteraceae bacterium]